MKDKASPGHVVAAWAEIDRRLSQDPYLRFSIQSHRNWENTKKRLWQAMISREAGGRSRCETLISRAWGDTREEALLTMMQGLPAEE